MLAESVRCPFDFCVVRVSLRRVCGCVCVCACVCACVAVLSPPPPFTYFLSHYMCRCRYCLKRGRWPILMAISGLILMNFASWWFSFSARTKWGSLPSRASSRGHLSHSLMKRSRASSWRGAFDFSLLHMSEYSTIIMILFNDYIFVLERFFMHFSYYHITEYSTYLMLYLMIISW